MTTVKPFLTCALAIALVSAFEIAHNHLEKRWSTPGTKDGWTGLFWLLVYSTFMLCGFMPYSRQTYTRGFHSLPSALYTLCTPLKVGDFIFGELLTTSSQHLLHQPGQLNPKFEIFRNSDSSHPKTSKNNEGLTI